MLLNDKLYSVYSSPKCNSDKEIKTTATGGLYSTYRTGEDEHMEDSDIDGNIILKLVLNADFRVRNEFIWLRTNYTEGLL